MLCEVHGNQNEECESNWCALRLEYVSGNSMRKCVNNFENNTSVEIIIAATFMKIIEPNNATGAAPTFTYSAHYDQLYSVYMCRWRYCNDEAAYDNVYKAFGRHNSYRMKHIRDAMENLFPESMTSTTTAITLATPSITPNYNLSTTTSANNIRSTTTKHVNNKTSLHQSHLNIISIYLIVIFYNIII